MSPLPSDTPCVTPVAHRRRWHRGAGTLAWAAACALLSACSGAGAGAAGADPPMVQVPAEPTGGDGSPTPGATGSQSCTLTTAAWQPLDGDAMGSPLRAPGTTEPFVYVLGGRGRLKLAATAGAGAVPLTLSRGGVELRGVMEAASLPLHPRRPVVFEDFVIPSADAQLVWRGSGSSGVRVSYTLRGGLEADKLQATVACADLTLDVTPFDSSAKLLAGKRGRLARLRFDRKVPLSATPGSAAVAWIDPDAPDDDGYTTDQVRELAFDGTHSRIVWLRPRDTVFGWVPADAIYVLEDDVRDLSEDETMGMIGLLSGAEADAPSGMWRCRKDLPLLASVADRAPVPVGTLKAGTAFERLEQEDQQTAIVVPDVLDASGTFVVGDEARILVQASALVDCGEIR